MKITIETSDSERVSLQPESQSLLRQGQGTGASPDLVATDAGPPSAELLQSLSERSVATTATATAEAEQNGRMDMSNGGAAQSRH